MADPDPVPDPTPDAVARPVALDGRALGRRGAQTRRRLLDATAELLERDGAFDLRVVDIARRVGTSPAAFYQYFRDVEDAVLVLAADAGAQITALAPQVDDSWRLPGGIGRVEAFVDAWIARWDAHRVVLSVRNLAAQEGDGRFRELRRAANAPFIEGFVAIVRASQRRGNVAPEISPVAAAAALVSLVERMAAFHRELEQMDVGRAELVVTTARIVHQTLVGTESA